MRLLLIEDDEILGEGLRRELGREIVETIRGLGYRIGAQP